MAVIYIIIAAGGHLGHNSHFARPGMLSTTLQTLTGTFYITIVRLLN